MAIRVTAEEVKRHLNVKQFSASSDFEDTKIDDWIAIASPWVDDIETADINSVLSAARLKQIEMMLSCHLISATIHRQEQESFKANVSRKFQGKTDFTDFRSTTYGQIALKLDITGTLISINSEPDNSGILVI